MNDNKSLVAPATLLPVEEGLPEMNLAQQRCPRCKGDGSVEEGSFVSTGSKVSHSCYLCHGIGIIYRTQDELAELLTAALKESRDLRELLRECQGFVSLKRFPSLSAKIKSAIGSTR